MEPCCGFFEQPFKDRDFRQELDMRGGQVGLGVTDFSKRAAEWGVKECHGFAVNNWTVTTPM